MVGCYIDVANDFWAWRCAFGEYRRTRAAAVLAAVRARERRVEERKVDVEGVGKGAGRVEEATRRGRKTRQPARRRPEKNLRYI